MSRAVADDSTISGAHVLEPRVFNSLEADPQFCIAKHMSEMGSEASPCTYILSIA